MPPTRSPRHPDPRAVRGSVLLQGPAPRALRPGPVRSTAIRPSSTSRAVAAELGVVLPLSVYERAGQAHVQLGRGRRRRRRGARHLPQEPHPRRARLHREVLLQRRATPASGCGTRATPRSASASAGTSGSPSRRAAWRCSGAEVLLYPTAIGSEPPDPSWDSSGHWQRVMQGHAGANLMPLVAANRVGHEIGADVRDHVLRLVVHRRRHRRKVAEAGRDGEAVLTATFDLERTRAHSGHAWGLFRDRRPDLYGPLLTLDGRDRSMTGGWPAEWAPHAAHGDVLAGARRHVRAASSAPPSAPTPRSPTPIAGFEPVTMIAAPRTAERAAAMCGGRRGGRRAADRRLVVPRHRPDLRGRRRRGAGGDRLACSTRGATSSCPYDDDALAARRFADVAGDPVRSVDDGVRGWVDHGRRRRARWSPPRSA